jgi:hypothetical protein
MVEIVSASLPYDECPQKIRDTLVVTGGDINATVAILLQDQDEMDSDEDFDESPEEQQYSFGNLEIQPPTEAVRLSPSVEAHEAMLISVRAPSAAFECSSEEQGDLSRIKRRKSSDGTPTSAYVSSSEESSSLGSSGAPSSASSVSSDSEGRRRKLIVKLKLPQPKPEPTPRRSKRIKNKAKANAEAIAAALAAPPQEPTPKRRIKKATGCRKPKSDNKMKPTRNGFRELYV